MIGASGKVIGYRCDVTDNEAVKKAFDWIDANYGGVKILINNAGLIGYTTIEYENTKKTMFFFLDSCSKSMILDEDNETILHSVINTNTLGLLNTTKAAYRHMKKYDSYGHVINVNSVAGHSCVSMTKEPLLNVYAGSKHFVTATTEILRQELNSLQNRKVRVSVSHN